MWFHRAKFWDAGWDQHLRTSRLIWAETAKSLAFADWLFLFTWMAWPGLPRRSTNPRFFLCHQRSSKVKIVTLRVRIPISRWALIKMDDQATHRFSRTIWPKNAMVGKMRAAQLKFLVEPCSCERDTACPGTRNRRGWQEFPCGPRASKTPAADLLDVWAFQLSPLRVWKFLAKPIKH